MEQSESAHSVLVLGCVTRSGCVQVPVPIGQAASFEDAPLRPQTVWGLVDVPRFILEGGRYILLVSAMLLTALQLYECSPLGAQQARAKSGDKLFDRALRRPDGAYAVPLTPFDSGKFSLPDGLILVFGFLHQSQTVLRQFFLCEMDDAQA